MRFAELAAAYGRIEATTKRLEMRTLLADLFRATSREELGPLLYLSQGLLAPEYEGVELGMADSLARRAVAQATGASDEAIALSLRASGDLGTTAEELLVKNPRSAPSRPLDVREVYDDLLRISRASGEGSQEAKIGILLALLERCSPVEARYLVRFVLGRLRLGVREMTLLDALAERFAGGTKTGRQKIEAAFNVCSDLALVADALAGSGLEGLDSIHLTVGRPVRAMLGERSPTLADVLERMDGRAALEYKYDGLRIQAHVPAHGPARLFSRRLEDISAQFPELVAALPKALAGLPAIVEGECVPIDANTDEIRPFQEVSRRRGRKYDLERMQEEVPVVLFLFDVLLSPDGPEIDKPLPERRERLSALVRPDQRVRLAVQRIVDSVDDAQAFFDESIAAGCEGVMAKSLSAESTYRAGARGFWWIKYKREYTHGLADSIDGVVVGGFHGRGRRAGRYGALLLATYDPEHDRFESFCKVGSGFDDIGLSELPEKLRPFEVKERPEGVQTELVPDQWMRPGLVLEVRGAELTLSPIHRAAFGRVRPGTGFALRFPRFTGRYRDDKGPTDATTGEELLRLYRTQVRQEAAGAGESDGA
ncbi:MAG TPA: ATP-dependent DNA ligase [Thermoplasmata archaeon]|nr:ATP-dependent DNA ligase [Thermoplasmata archaeon]